MRVTVCVAWAATVLAAPVAPTVPEQAKAAAPGLTVYHWWTSVSELAALNALVTVFKSQAPGVVVDVKATGAHGGGGRMFQQVSLAVAAGQPPDVFQTQPGAPLEPYVDAGLLLPMDQLWATSGMEKAVPPMIRDLSRINGRYYALPINVHRNNLIWYNKALLEKHGIDPGAIATWDALFAAADKLRAAGVQSPLQIGEGWTLSVAFESAMAGLGIGPYEDWINGKITAADDPRLLEAFGLLKRYLAYANPDHAGTGWDVAIKRLIRGEAAFCLMGDWANGEFQAARMNYGSDYGALPVPRTRGLFGVTADAFSAARATSQPANANLWLSVAASRQGQDAFNARKGSISARTDADASHYDTYQRSAMAEFKGARHLYPSLTSATHGGFRSAVDNIMGRFGADLDVRKAAAAMATAAAEHRGKLRRKWSLQ